MKENVFPFTGYTTDDDDVAMILCYARPEGTGNTSIPQLPV